MDTLYSNLIKSLASPILQAYREGNTELAKLLLTNKNNEHGITLAIDLTRYIQSELTKP